MISFRSVKFRLTIWYTLLLTILLTLYAFFMHWELAKALYRDADHRLMKESKMIQSSVLKEIPSAFAENELDQSHTYFATSLYFEPEVKAKLISKITNWENVNKRVSRSRILVRLIGLDRTTLCMNLKRWEEEVIFPDFERDSVFMERGESFQTIHFRKMPVRLYYRLVRYKNVPVFIIQTGVPLQEVENTLRRLAIIITVTIPIVMIAAFFAGWFMAKRSFQPLDLMIREARQITGAEIKKRLPRTSAGDELDRLAETLNEMMDRIEASKKVIQDFSSDISHELKTPLAIIRGEIDLAFRKIRSAEELSKTIRVIEGEVNELIRLVDDLIFLVRTDARQLRFVMSEVSLTEILEHAVDRFKTAADVKKITLTRAIDSRMTMMGDAVYLKRVFTNLLDNAIKFTPEGGRIHLSAVIQNRLAKVEVSDTGMGIEEDKISKVFGRFYRTDNARQYEGSGLGLNIAQVITDAHGGKIHMKSKVANGTTVTLHFPLLCN